jgi:hypothetical protein
VRARRGATVAAATLAAVAGWTIAGPLTGIHLAAGSTRHIGAAQVIASSLVAGLAAWALLAVLEHFTSRARTVWTIAAAAVLILSLTGPLGAASVSAGLALGCLHLLVGGILIAGLRRPLAPRSARRSPATSPRPSPH